jgi:hypothetical protein
MKLNPAHVGIDTCAKAMGGLNQNDAMDTGLLVAAMGMVRRQFDCCVTGVHHPNKSDPDEMRGSGALTNDVDTTVAVYRPKGTMLTRWSFSKLKAAKKPNPYILRSEVYDVGIVDEAGHPVTYPAFRFSHEMTNKTEPQERGEEGELDRLKERVIAVLRRATKTEGEYISTEQIVTMLWPPEPDEGEEYEKRKQLRVNELNKYGGDHGRKLKDAGVLKAFVKRTRKGDQYEPLRWYLRSYYRTEAAGEAETVGEAVY